MRWCVCLAAGVPPGLPAIGRLLINYKHWPHLGPPGPPTSCQPAAARARRRASPALGTVHLALCRCHVIPHCTGCHLNPSSPAPPSLPGSAASPSPSRHSSVLAPPPLSVSHPFCPAIMLLMLLFSAFLLLQRHSRGRPSICRASLPRSAGSSLPILPGQFCMCIRHPCSLIPSQLRAPCGPEWHRTAFHQGQPCPPDSLYRYWGPTRPCSLGNPAMGSCDLDRDLRPLPFLFLPMISSFRCLAVV